MAFAVSFRHAEAAFAYLRPTRPCRPLCVAATPNNMARVRSVTKKPEKEMMVADLRPASAVAAPPARRKVPVPEVPAAPLSPQAAQPSTSAGFAGTAAKVPAAPSVASGSGTSSSSALAIRDASTAATVPLQLKRTMAVQSGATKALQAELRQTQTQAKQTGIELRETKAALVAKDREIAELQAALAERDGKLKAARADALEGKMALVVKDAELVDAYKQLSYSVQQRSQLRTELAQRRVNGRDCCCCLSAITACCLLIHRRYG